MFGTQDKSHFSSFLGKCWSFFVTVLFIVASFSFLHVIMTCISIHVSTPLSFSPSTHLSKHQRSWFLVKKLWKIIDSKRWKIIIPHMVKKFSAFDYKCPIKHPVVIIYGTRVWNQAFFLLKTFFYISGAMRGAKRIEKHRN